MYTDNKTHIYHLKLFLCCHSEYLQKGNGCLYT